MQHRRQFLKNSFLASSSLMVPAFLTASDLELKPKTSRDGTILIVIQLSGGNDGLNTVVPYRNDIYYRSRAEINIAPSSVLKLHDDLGFNPALQSLQTIFDRGEMSVLNEVGYPNPDRSHFRSMDIW
ncbi:MAG: twin-arginine translocation pathway signal, partial [Saprospiraceae bacterium]|nr:twin-arginine translocation pathway signal [Saprospiraceae bacterium]